MRSIAAIGILLGIAGAAGAAAPSELTTLHAIHSLSNAEASRNPRVSFTATVTYRRATETTLFVQDGEDALYVFADTKFKMSIGDRVLIRGKAQDSYHPIVIADSIVVVGHGELPRPVRVNYRELLLPRNDGVRVTIQARMYSADLVKGKGLPGGHAQLSMDGGVIGAYICDVKDGRLTGLLDTQVEVTGLDVAKFDSKMQRIGNGLIIAGMADVTVLSPARTDPWALPLTEMDQIIDSQYVKDLSRRIHVRGTVTYYQPGSALVLQNGTKSLWVITGFDHDDLRVGSQADVIGFSEVHDGFLALTNSEVHPIPVYTPLAPRPVTGNQLRAFKNVFDLVSLEGQVVMEVRESSQDEYVLVSKGQLFSAIYRHPNVPGASTPAMKQVAIGSKIRVSGICILESSNAFNDQVPFNILLRSPEDVQVISGPSWLSVGNLVVVTGLLLVVVLAVGSRGWFIERTMRRQTATVASIEERRGRILEDINKSRPLAEIIEEITGLASFKLNGAPCWCDVTDGAQLGNCPLAFTGLRIVEHEIAARSGPALGTLYAAFDATTKENAGDLEALSMAAALITLAVETGQVYSDLRRRSEFDLLTDIHNRFSFDTYLDRRIEEARMQASILALIYIDLDGFKKINDTFGHQVGDVYLREAARRMKGQLRPGDMLARMGGDEFVALVPEVRSRADIEEITTRLERCFQEPFVVDGRILQGAASLGLALYPQDGSSKDRLLAAADAAMYVGKHTKQHMDEDVRGR